MIIVWIVIALVVIVAVVLIALGRKKARRVDVLDNVPTVLPRGMGSIDPGPIMDVMPLSSDEFTDAPSARDSGFDATDDLLDPNNPQHREWVNEHPEDATNVDLGDDGTDSTPSSS